LHGSPWPLARVSVQLLRNYGEKTINHSVRLSGLEGTVLGKCFERLVKWEIMVFSNPRAML
jgi:hypothetical protein